MDIEYIVKSIRSYGLTTVSLFFTFFALCSIKFIQIYVLTDPVVRITRIQPWKALSAEIFQPLGVAAETPTAVENLDLRIDYGDVRRRGARQPVQPGIYPFHITDNL